MPTVLDLLRADLLGSEAAVALEQFLAHMNDTLAVMPRVPLQPASIFPSLPVAATDAPNPIVESLRTPSLGIEPLLVEAGWNQLAARAVAKLAVRHGRRRDDESRRERAVVDAIRLLAKAKQKRALLRCARLLLQADGDSTIIGSIFGAAGLHEGEFIHLLEDVAGGREVDRDRIRQIASSIGPHLALRRGPKVSAVSAAYEFICSPEFGFEIPDCPHPTYEKDGEYINPLTAAIRIEFKAPDFDPRPAQRRTKRKRLKLRQN